MTALADLIASSPDRAVTAGALLIGLLFGALLTRTGFCTLAAISDWLVMGARGRLGATALAMATAIVGAQTLAAYDVVDLSKSIYLAPRINWLGGLFGGMIFGAGMVYAGGCPSRSMVRAGGGDVRSLLALVVMGIAAYATIGGVLGSARASLDLATAIDLKPHGVATQSLGDVLALAGLDAQIGRWSGVAVVAVLLIVAFGYAGVGGNLDNVVGGLGVGLLAVAGWALTGLAADEFAARPVQPTSLSFVKPVGDAIDWIERSTALGLPGFGAASVFGTLLGALTVAFLTRRFHVRSFVDLDDVWRHLGGGIAMGIGGVAALGCTVGQGVSGISTLAVQSFIAFAGICAGAVLALKRLARSV